MWYKKSISRPLHSVHFTAIFTHSRLNDLLLMTCLSIKGHSVASCCTRPLWNSSYYVRRNIRTMPPSPYWVSRASMYIQYYSRLKEDHHHSTSSHSHISFTNGGMLYHTRRLNEVESGYSPCPPVRLSVRLWTESCPLCIFHNIHPTHFVFTDFINQLQVSRADFF